MKTFEDFKNQIAKKYGLANWDFVPFSMRELYLEEAVDAYVKYQTKEIYERGYGAGYEASSRKKK